jgi:hypothetical protein
MTDLLAENFENFWENVVLRKIFRTVFFGKISSTSPPPPPPRRQYFPGKIFAFRKFFLWGLGIEGAQILDYTPPIRNRLARPWLWISVVKMAEQSFFLQR